MGGGPGIEHADELVDRPLCFHGEAFFEHAGGWWFNLGVEIQQWLAVGRPETPYGVVVVVFDDRINRRIYLRQEVTPIGQNAVGFQHAFTGPPDGGAIKPVQRLSDGDGIDAVGLNRGGALRSRLRK